MWIFLLGCAGPVESVAEQPSDYSTHAAPTLRTHCTACHGALQAEGGVQLHTLSLASQVGERALVRMMEGSMPPGGGVSAAEIQAFTLWLEQGKPGQEPDPTPAEIPSRGRLSLEVNAFVTELSPGRFELVWEGALTQTPFSREVWLLQGSAISLEERTVAEEGSAAEVLDRWEPPLRIFDPTQESWTQETQHSRVDALGQDVWSERWTAQSWDALDPRAYDRTAVGSWVSEEGGASMGFQASALFLVARSSQDPEFGLQQTLMVRTEALPQTLLQDGLVWTDRVILWP